MTTEAQKKKFLRLERERVTRLKHQHRGLDFIKLWLPPSADRKVNIIGHNNHIYKGRLPTYPIDQLPPEVDPNSINEEELYKEIRDLHFPEVPPLQPLGPARRIGGAYTTAKKLTFAPVAINLDDDKVEIPILGADGKIYKGSTKAVPARLLDQRLAGTKRAAKTPGSSRDTVKPTVVSLHVDGEPLLQRKPQVPIVELPYADLDKLTKWMEISTPVQKKEAPEQSEEQPPEPEESEKKEEHETEVEESEGESFGELATSESVETAGEISETTTTSVTEVSSEVAEPVSEVEETEEEITEGEVTESEISESEPEEEIQ